MTREDRIRAFEMRLDGCTWEEIGACIGYDAQAVYKDLSRIFERVNRKQEIIYPTLKHLIEVDYGNSIYNYAIHLKTTPQALRDVLTGKIEPTSVIVQKILNDTCGTFEEVFKK